MALSPEERSALIHLARSAVEAQVRGLPEPSVGSPTGVAAQLRGCFVTLTNHERLRGCVGIFTPTEPLARTIVEMGQAAARDSRFVMNPITADELDQLTVEVSVLSELVETSEPRKLKIGTDGIYVIRGPHRGCFLPEVAVDQGWDAPEFLSRCCRGKAGLAPNAWEDPETKVYLFTSESL